MTSSRLAGMYVGDSDVEGAGAAALAAQLFVAPGTGLRVGKPSDAKVDDDGVLGRFIIALVGIGLSIS